MTDIPNLEQRLRKLAAAPDDADWTDVLKRAGERLPARPFSRRRLVLALAAVVVIAAALAGVFVGLGERPTGPTGPSAVVVGPPPSPAGNNPFGPDGRQITIAQLRNEAPYIPLPDSDLANDDNAGTVWVRDYASDSNVPERYTWAAVYYPDSGIELRWGRGTYECTYGPVVDGVHACVQSGHDTTGAQGASALSMLVLPLLPDAVATLEGKVPESDLINVAETLSTKATSPDVALPPANPQPGLYLRDWVAGVLTHAVSAGSVDAAAGSLAFQPVHPRALGEPSAILQTDPASTAPSDRVLSLRYDDPSMGRYWLLERPSLSTTTSLLRTIASDCTDANDCRATGSMVDLGGEVSALSVERFWAPEWIAWVENGVYYEVIGQGQEGAFSATDALSIAKTVAAAASR